MYKTIESTKNPTIKRFKELASAKGRREHGAFIAEGEKLFMEACASGIKIRTVIADEAYISKNAALMAKLSASGADVYTASAKAIEAAADANTPQRVIAECAIPAPVRPAAKGLFVALDGVQDPGNMGTVIRSADAFGAAGAILSADCADVWSPKCVRSAMGSSFHIPVYRAAEIGKTLASMRGAGFCIIAGHLKGQDELPQSLGEKAVLLVGSEGRGIRPETAKEATHLYRLSMKGRAESLNAAVFAGILLYELSQRM